MVFYGYKHHNIDNRYKFKQGNVNFNGKILVFCQETVD